MDFGLCGGVDAVSNSEEFYKTLVDQWATNRGAEGPQVDFRRKIISPEWGEDILEFFINIQKKFWLHCPVDKVTRCVNRRL